MDHICQVAAACNFMSEHIGSAPLKRACPTVRSPCAPYSQPVRVVRWYDLLRCLSST